MSKVKFSAAAFVLLGVLASPVLHAADAAPKQPEVVKQTRPFRSPMHEMMKDFYALNKDKMQAMQDKKAELHKLMTAEKFDKEAYLAKHKEVEAMRADFARERGKAMAEKLASMPAKERMQLPMMGHGKMMGHPKGQGGRGAGMGQPDVE